MALNNIHIKIFTQTFNSISSSANNNTTRTIHDIGNTGNHELMHRSPAAANIKREKTRQYVLPGKRTQHDL